MFLTLNGRSFFQILQISLFVIIRNNKYVKIILLATSSLFKPYIKSACEKLKYFHRKLAHAMQCNYYLAITAFFSLSYASVIPCQKTAGHNINSNRQISLLASQLF